MCCVTINLSFKECERIHGEASSFLPNSFVRLSFLYACEAPLSFVFVTLPCSLVFIVLLLIMQLLVLFLHAKLLQILLL
jgi:hypothetical protein